MNKRRLIFIMLFLIVICIPVIFSTTQITAQQTAELEIAVVDYNKVFYEYSATRTQYLQLKKEKQRLEEYIVENQTEIEDAKDVYNEQEKFYNDSRRREELLKIWMMMLELDLKIKQDSAKLKEAEDTIIKQLDSEIRRVVDAVRKSRNVDIVINSESVFTFDSGIEDITDTVIKNLN